MPRSIRIEYPGAFYHVMAGGNRREAIFRDEADRRFFLQTLGEACGMTGWRIHAWVLLSNHYHLFVQIPEANLSKGRRQVPQIIEVASGLLRRSIVRPVVQVTWADDSSVLIFTPRGYDLHIQRREVGGVRVDFR